MTLTRAILPGLAAALALAAAASPAMQGQRDLRDVLIVVDITRSMNVRDMNGVSRLDAARGLLTRWIASQPCGTRVGLGFFTERRSLTLIAPVEICADYAALTETLAGLDWRMAWEGDSMISKGLNHALTRARDLDAALVFVTDGQEAPPLPYSGPDPWHEDSPGGVILGAGGDTPAPIPKFDDLGRETGFYGAEDVQHAPARIGAPPTDAADRPGYHPRNNPYGEADLDGTEHLSALRADYLTGLAAERGMGFARLSDGPAALQAALATHADARQVTTRRSLSPVLGALALAALLAALLATPFTARKETP
ncbi:VWA domain-containing protein [Paracoccus shanxieyensis]|uniref:VWA domain-containing protein n=1 Tax=Paracoccus shanxieyensis TaxID=2675752 RepID=A0A6L6J064_9RHOB|nr:VWA domain-containing protein [Paracoccus shanxieyensis]MTH64047.1 VWA domain-containing protein [Paracoccus shanxieyensis]MTH86912.1 VWA domain-containing protein [Paracoccus shanxieyensis]